MGSDFFDSHAKLEYGSLKSLIEILVRALVDDPDSVDVKEVYEGGAITYEVTVAPDDVGKVIGKDGRVANALRTVAKAAALKEHKSVYVKIMP